MKLIKAVRGEAILVDDVDFEPLSKYRWHAVRGSRTNVYAATFNPSSDRVSITMHAMLMNPPDGKLVDHKNGIGMDNRRKNLRIATYQQNAANRPSTSGIKGAGETHTEFIGVSKTAALKYRCYVNSGGRNNGKQHWVGIFDTAEEAAVARDRVALYFHGADARLNFPGRSLSAASPIEIRKEKRAKRGLRGASKVTGGRGWCSKIRDTSTGTQCYLGTYDTPEEAALAYDSAALYMGAPRHDLNFPDRDTIGESPYDIRNRIVARGIAGYIGVRRKRNRFSADIMRNRKLHRLGVFDTAEEAARAYDTKARELGEEFNLNFPLGRGIGA